MNLKAKLPPNSDIANTELILWAEELDLKEVLKPALSKIDN